MNIKQLRNTGGFQWLSEVPQITIVGFSLTGYGKPSFGNLLENKLRAIGWNGVVKEISYGGLSINALAGLLPAELDRLPAKGIVLLELTTSFYSLHKYTLQDAKPFISAIARQILTSSQRSFCFLNLYRYDLDDNDCVVESIRCVSETYAAPIIDLKTPFRAHYTGQVFGVDGIHPDTQASELIAAAIYNFLGSGSWTHVDPFSAEQHPQYSYLDLVPLVHGLDIFQHEARGATIRAAIAPAASLLTINLDRHLDVVGYYFLYGPETGFVNIALDTHPTTELITFDEHSYYRRIGFRPIERKGSSVIISVPPKTRPIALVKPTNLAPASRREFLCGFLTQHQPPIVQLD